MQKSRVFTIIKWTVCILILVGMTLCILPKGSVLGGSDFSGFVKEVKTVEGNLCVCLGETPVNSDLTYEITIPAKSRCKKLNGDPFDLFQIKTGDFVKIDFKKKPKFVDGQGYVATARGTVVVVPHAENTPAGN